MLLHYFDFFFHFSLVLYLLVLFIQSLMNCLLFLNHLFRVLQQLRKDHAGVQTPDRRQFTSIDDALQRLLPYHVFQGAPPSQDEFSQGTP